MKMKNYLKATFLFVAIVLVFKTGAEISGCRSSFIAECRSFGKWRRIFANSLLWTRISRLSC